MHPSPAALHFQGRDSHIGELFASPGRQEERLQSLLSVLTVKAGLVTGSAEASLPLQAISAGLAFSSEIERNVFPERGHCSKWCTNVEKAVFQLSEVDMEIDVITPGSIHLAVHHTGTGT